MVVYFSIFKKAASHKPHPLLRDMLMDRNQRSYLMENEIRLLCHRLGPPSTGQCFCVCRDQEEGAEEGVGRRGGQVQKTTTPEDGHRDPCGQY